MSRLRSIRERLGLSQQAMGKRLGLSQPAVAAIEKSGCERGPVALLLDQIERDLAAGVAAGPVVEPAPSAPPPPGADGAEAPCSTVSVGVEQGGAL
jgi:transcriptional regulator with XRE-family HTH domain